jgi:hypothetical protein
MADGLFRLRRQHRRLRRFTITTFHRITGMATPEFLHRRRTIIIHLRRNRRLRHQRRM